MNEIKYMIPIHIISIARQCLLSQSKIEIKTFEFRNEFLLYVSNVSSTYKVRLHFAHLESQAEN